SHAIPTVLAFLFLIFRTEILPYRKDPAAIRYGLIASLLLLSLSWCLFVIANIAILANITILLCVPTAIAICYSLKTARFLLPLCGILLFTLPIFGQLNDILVLMSAFVVGSLVHLVGMTAFIDGQSIFLPSGHIYIADGCSGLRYLTISILLGYLLAILNNYSAKRAIFTFFVAILLGLMTNWLRIFLLVVIGDVTEMRSSLMHDHELFGWILFSCVMLPAIYFSPIMPKKILPVETEAQIHPLIPLLVLAAGPLLIALMPAATQNTAQFTLKALGAPDQQFHTDTPIAIKTPAGISRELRQKNIDGVTLTIQLTQYKPTNAKEKIIPYFESLFNQEEWRVSSVATSKQLEKLGFQTLILNQSNSYNNVIFLYRFEVGQFNGNTYKQAKILQIPATFSNKRYSNFFSVVGKCEDETCSKEMSAAEKLAIDWHQQTKSLR
ncbi:MAG: hypothetical protein EOO07_05845, partial [Chitinophagaceae bacterium]